MSFDTSNFDGLLFDVGAQQQLQNLHKPVFRRRNRMRRGNKDREVVLVRIMRRVR